MAKETFVSKIFSAMSERLANAKDSTNAAKQLLQSGTGAFAFSLGGKREERSDIKWDVLIDKIKKSHGLSDFSHKNFVASVAEMKGDDLRREMLAFLLSYLCGVVPKRAVYILSALDLSAEDLFSLSADLEFEGSIKLSKEFFESLLHVCNVVSESPEYRSIRDIFSHSEKRSGIVKLD